MQACRVRTNLIGLVDREQSTRDEIQQQDQGDVVVISVGMALTDLAVCTGLLATACFYPVSTSATTSPLAAATSLDHLFSAKTKCFWKNGRASV
jgi:hypothetical protein